MSVLAALMDKGLDGDVLRLLRLADVDKTEADDGTVLVPDLEI